MSQLCFNYFNTWLDGGAKHIAIPDPPSSEEAKPFIVRIGTSILIPCNVLVFARDAEHAKNRVMAALRECCELDYRGKGGKDHGKWVSRGQQYDMLAKVERGEYQIQITPLDITLMPGVEWASNGGL